MKRKEVDGAKVDYIVNVLVKVVERDGVHPTCLAMGPLTWLAWLRFLLPDARCLTDVQSIKVKGIQVVVQPGLREGQVVRVVSKMLSEAEP